MSVTRAIAVRPRFRPTMLPKPASPVGTAIPITAAPSASGEIYDMEQMTAAHRTLPFGTRVQVENIDNGMTTEVRINDRGPFVGQSRDRSFACRGAGAIEMIGPGIAHVRLTIVGRPRRSGAGAVRHPGGGLREPRQCRPYADAHGRISTARPTLRLRAGTPPVWRVLVGRAPDPEHAETLARQIRADRERTRSFRGPAGPDCRAVFQHFRNLTLFRFAFPADKPDRTKWHFSRSILRTAWSGSRRQIRQIRAQNRAARNFAKRRFCCWAKAAPVRR